MHIYCVEYTTVACKVDYFKENLPEISNFRSNYHSYKLCIFTLNLLIKSRKIRKYLLIIEDFISCTFCAKINKQNTLYNGGHLVKLIDSIHCRGLTS